MPLLIHAVLGALGMHGKAVQHARLPDREIGDVDHLLDFAIALGLDLAVLQRHQAAERVFVGAQFLAHQAYGFAAFRRRDLTPLLGGLNGGGHDLLVVRKGRAAHLGQPLAARGVEGVDQRTGLG